MEKGVKEKNVNLTVKRDFYDRTDGLKLKKKGEELTVSPDRAEKLISLGLAEKANAVRTRIIERSKRLDPDNRNLKREAFPQLLTPNSSLTHSPTPAHTFYRRNPAPGQSRRDRGRGSAPIPYCTRAW